MKDLVSHVTLLSDYKNIVVCSKPSVSSILAWTKMLTFGVNWNEKFGVSGHSVEWL